MRRWYLLSCEELWGDVCLSLKDFNTPPYKMPMWDQDADVWGSWKTSKGLVPWQEDNTLPNPYAGNSICPED